MNGRWRFSFGEGCEGLAWSGLDDVGTPSSNAFTAETPAGETVQSASSPSACRKPPDINEISGE